MIVGWGISCEIVLTWMPQDLTNDKSTLVQVMAWCHQATSHYLSQCWPSSLSPYGVIRPQWIKELACQPFCVSLNNLNLNMNRMNNWFIDSYNFTHTCPFFQEHDSYRAFRSLCWNYSLSLVTKPHDEQSNLKPSLPSCIFYASTLRWIDKVKMCMTSVSRPIRRGKYFNRAEPRKPQLSRHIR